MKKHQTIQPLKFADVTPAVKRHATKKRCSYWTKIIFIGSPILVVAIIAAGITLQLRKSSDLDLSNVYVVTKRVSRHYQLPAGETPALATVTDKKSLQTPFLQQANNGDKILIYQKAQRVIIYRPDTDKIIDVGPVSVAPSTAGSTQ
ncbi:MAG TPA: hypothetical protein VMR45_02985 [Patescibacteria group bacterium]|nr:hypothetical protein [Patescibacteria group bacterium]